MIEFNELTKKVVAFLDEMQNLGFELRYDVSVDNALDFEVIEVDFSSTLHQSLVYCLLHDLCINKDCLSCHSEENLFIYCDND